MHRSDRTGKVADRQEAIRLDIALRRHGSRPTRQRRALYAALLGRTDHPTAEALHRSVRRRLPGLSLATVYTTLEVLAAAGLVARIAAPDGVARYDARIDVHDHRRCLGCDRIEDFNRLPGASVLEAFHAPGFQATDYRIEVVGYCAACSDRGGASHSPSTKEGDQA
jgi:Fe2+ or Zn2+ uptake regulation protein